MRQNTFLRNTKPIQLSMNEMYFYRGVGERFFTRYRRGGGEQFSINEMYFYRGGGGDFLQGTIGGGGGGGK